MPDFGNTSAPRDFGELIPKGTVAPVQLRIKRGGHGEGGLLTATSTEKGDSAYLHVEATILDGAHKGRKLWGRYTVEGANHASAIGPSYDLLGSLLRSARNLTMADRSPEALAKLNAGFKTFDGLCCVVRVGVEKGKLKSDGSGESWPDKNTIASGVCRGDAGWPGPIEQKPLDDDLSPVMGGAPPAPPTSGSVQRPSWAQ
jgi:hypothetical protein